MRTGLVCAILKVKPNVFLSSSYSYHQKYRLQHHKELASQLKLSPQLLQTSHIAARLNGYLVGVGGVKQFDDEAESLGLTKEQIEYVRKYVVDNEGGGLTC